VPDNYHAKLWCVFLAVYLTVEATTITTSIKNIAGGPIASVDREKTTGKQTQY
jgi:hypothetical protein